jgi:hypothetical protein
MISLVVRAGCERDAEENQAQAHHHISTISAVQAECFEQTQLEYKIA